MFTIRYLAIRKVCGIGKYLFHQVIKINYFLQHVGPQKLKSKTLKAPNLIK